MYWEQPTLESFADNDNAAVVSLVVSVYHTVPVYVIRNETRLL